ncbi:spore maturation protein [Candidatus Comchoanobacter bicostacola]|uniref:Spore maturation protein n=1 Tax=Candidatus Comchoanobacter bicostacola TaxID=2919598 RepID=A0ABY5DK33_9GAMM|nr:nucleoside recognition domain-containing protein [Candidatus Comchoanobacter bicostacola]UTC24644.1 spore maturation protein [Candidatus Comchoanobacter bicostacola]
MIAFSSLIFASIILFIPLHGLSNRLDIYNSFLNGGRNSFQVVVNIIPTIVGMYVAIGMLRASGFFDFLEIQLDPFLSLFNIPAAIVPLIIMRPLSGSGSIALLAETIQYFGPDSIEAITAATILGSTETTFYVVSVYFGAVGVKHYRYSVAIGLLADLAGIISAIVVCKYLFL